MHMTLVVGLGALIYSPLELFRQTYVVVVAMAALTPSALWFLSRRLSWRWLVGLVVCGAVGLVVLRPDVVSALRSSALFPDATVTEMVPGYFYIGHYGVAFPFFFVGLVLAAYRRENLLLIVWSAFMFVLALMQIRWSYYFTVNLAIMAAYAVYLTSENFHLLKDVSHPVVNWMRTKNVALLLSVVLILPSIPNTVAMCTAPVTLTDDWYRACVWLKENTPEDAGVTSHWNHGNWIIRIGQRAPLSNARAWGKGIKALISGEVPTDYIVTDQTTLNMLTNRYGRYIFVALLWHNKALEWQTAAQFGDVKIFERRKKDES